MLYIHKTYCISPQQEPLQEDIGKLDEPFDKKLLACEPAYEKIPSGILRRMGKAIRMGVGASLPLISEIGKIDGIIIGSANAGMEECVKFLNQIVDYDEGQLTPGSFVQSTGNVIAGQLGMISKNKGYNITHAHKGLAFENAMIDAIMQLNANPSNRYLLGGIDDLSSFQYNIENLNGVFKKEDISNQNLYESDTPGCLPGEGAAMFVVDAEINDSIAAIRSVHTFHSNDIGFVKQQLDLFIGKHLSAEEEIDILISGENGDIHTLPFYEACESVVADNTTVVRFKHLCGEYETASAIGLWYACEILVTRNIPRQMIKKTSLKTGYRNVLMYNNFAGYQHSIVLVSGT